MLLSGVSYPAGHKLTAAELAAIITAVQGLSTTVVKTADESVTSSIVLQDDNELLFTAAANATYEVWAFLHYIGVNAGGILKIGWAGPASATFDWTASGLATGAIATTGNLDASYLSLASTITLGGGANDVVARPSGLLVTSATSGTFKLQWAQGTSSATATTVKAGSFLAYRRIA